MAVTTISRGRAVSLPLDRSVGYQVRQTHRVLQRVLQGRIEREGVTLGMWYFLRVLWETDGLTQSELSARVGTMEPTTLSAVMAMERAGLVRRARHDSDKRKIVVSLTETGRALRDELLPEAAGVVAEATAGFAPEEITLLLGLLGRMRRNMGAG